MLRRAEGATIAQVGKTFTAITEVYRLLKFAGARRVLFLVDTRNLGEQAEQEFMAYVPNDDSRRLLSAARLRYGLDCRGHLHDAVTQRTVNPRSRPRGHN